MIWFPKLHDKRDWEPMHKWILYSYHYYQKSTCICVLGSSKCVMDVFGSSWRLSLLSHRHVWRFFLGKELPHPPTHAHTDTHYRAIFTHTKISSVSTYPCHLMCAWCIHLSVTQVYRFLYWFIKFVNFVDYVRWRVLYLFGLHVILLSLHLVYIMLPVFFWMSFVFVVNCLKTKLF